MTTSFQLYRGAKIGNCLYQSLFDLIEAGKLSEELADKVLAQFDKSMYQALEEKVAERRAIIKANLKNYRYIDNVWQFVLDNVTLKVAGNGRPSSGNFEETMDCAKLVCVDSKLVLKDKAEAEGEAARLVAKVEDGQGKAVEYGLGRGVEMDYKGAVPGPGGVAAVAVKAEEQGFAVGAALSGMSGKRVEDIKTESA